MLTLDKSIVCSWNRPQRLAALVFESGVHGHGRPEVFCAWRSFQDPGCQSPGLFPRNTATLAAGRRGVSSPGLCLERELPVGLLRKTSRAMLRRHVVVPPPG